jgi:hypothetical protein
MPVRMILTLLTTVFPLNTSKSLSIKLVRFSTTLVSFIHSALAICLRFFVTFNAEIIQQKLKRKLKDK